MAEDIGLPTPRRALVVTPHPDDAEIGCGGTIARWVREGAEVFVLLATNGDKGTDDPSMTSERLAEIREREQEEASRALGVREVVFLGYPDGYLEDDHDFRARVVREIRRLRPEVVLTTDPFRRNFYLHRDHRICGLVTMDACFPYARDRLHYPQHEREGLRPHKVRTLLFWGSEDPDTYVDITPTIDLKIKALLCHRSQIKGWDVEEWVRRFARGHGERAGVDYAEAFRRMDFRD